ncbi:MAG TPA: efflux RND transporter permease subunit, partial [Sedimentisphaerales bacterium]|nr:efflux RND transporter permease subunit [Sedimentisphaerales bacterium]
FLPDEDEGFLFIAVKLPEGASLERTGETLAKVNSILEKTDGVDSYITIGGFSLLESAHLANSGTYFVILDKWDDRKSKNLQIDAIIANLQQKLFMVQDGLCFAFGPPAIMGLGLAGGFEIQIQDRAGVGFEALQNSCNELMFIGKNDPVITIRNSSFTANVPQFYLDVDRTKAKSLGIPLTNIFGTLQAHLGSVYVNDMNLFGRTYKVMIQADLEYRNKVDNILQLQVRNNQGEMVPLRSIATVKNSSGPQSVKHFNLYPCSTMSGSARAGHSSGEAMDYMDKLCKEKLPRGISYQWSGMSYQQTRAGEKSNFIFIMGLIFVFLFLAAQYESWSIPFAIILTVPIAVFGALFFTWFKGYDNNIYTQIGLVLLIGLASKTAILLVEFAKQHHEEGHSIIDSATTAARLRFRPILMTALSTLLGFAPLVVASGAGAVSRRALGTATFGGMLVATVAGVFMMPVLYVIIQRITEKVVGVKHKVEDKIMHHEHSDQ